MGNIAGQLVITTDSDLNSNTDFSDFSISFISFQLTDQGSMQLQGSLSCARAHAHDPNTVYIE